MIWERWELKLPFPVSLINSGSWKQNRCWTAAWTGYIHVGSKETLAQVSVVPTFCHILKSVDLGLSQLIPITLTCNPATAVWAIVSLLVALTVKREFSNHMLEFSILWWAAAKDSISWGVCVYWVVYTYWCILSLVWTHLDFWLLYLVMWVSDRWDSGAVSLLVLLDRHSLASVFWLVFIHCSCVVLSLS